MQGSAPFDWAVHHSFGQAGLTIQVHSAAVQLGSFSAAARSVYPSRSATQLTNKHVYLTFSSEPPGLIKHHRLESA